MHNHYISGFLALIVLAFAIFGWSNEVVIAGSALIFVYSIFDCSKSCSPRKQVSKKSTKKKK
ncbi:hypothetical protein COU58_00870 [Candidatus Pacearchaeota archaeon CG10_big_fil_rev_8_21_14_0_10_32_42]|nr:MAG: hypothetical protein COU58_00870 [Candidatus Pacearchaeota archaeon CG10_big_fil_rev_8_21_14_0_10_32_42]